MSTTGASVPTTGNTGSFEATPSDVVPFRLLLDGKEVPLELAPWPCDHRLEGVLERRVGKALQR